LALSDSNELLGDQQYVSSQLEANHRNMDHGLEQLNQPIKATHDGIHFYASPLEGSKEEMKRYCGNFRKNAAVQKRGADFVRACAVEMHFNMSQEPLYTKIYCTGKMPRPSWSTLMKHRPFYTYRKKPQCGHTVDGIWFIFIGVMSD